MKRLISADYSQISQMDRRELKQAIQASEGRTILSEVSAVGGPAANDITNAEVAAAYSADMILLNAFDCDMPLVLGMPGLSFDDLLQIFNGAKKPDPTVLHQLKKLIGRPLGINLEPVDANAVTMEKIDTIAAGRYATRATLQKARELGADFICLTGNPATGVTHKEIIRAIKEANEVFGGLIIAGKMHAAGVAEPILTEELVQAYIEAGVDVLLLPAAGTVPGIDQETLKKMVALAQAGGVLTMAAIGTSQESADPETIREIALMDKMIGVDIHHIGDSGFGGMALPENIYTLSKTVRGLRHTMNKMGRSIRR